MTNKLHQRARMEARGLSVFGTLLFGCAVFALMASCQSWRIVDVIPPQSLTETRLLVTYVRIQNFWNEHGKVPANSAELPVEENRDCSLMDGWGRELHWDSDGKTKVKVWSFGRDGKAGGTGEDADMEVQFVGKQKGQDDLPTIKRSDAAQ